MLLLLTNEACKELADEMIVGDGAIVPDAAKCRADTVGELFFRNLRLRRHLGDLVAMLVGAGEIKGLGALGPVVARQSVRDHHCVRAAQVIDSISGTCTIKGLSCGRPFASNIEATAATS